MSREGEKVPGSIGSLLEQHSQYGVLSGGQESAQWKGIRPDGKVYVLPERQRVLEEAVRLTTGDRDKTYGDATTNMRAFAALIDAYWTHRNPETSTPAHDAAIIMALAKIARIAVGQTTHRDNYVDAAAYIAMAYEAVLNEQPKDPAP